MRAVAFALALTLATTRAPLAIADDPPPAAPAPSSPAPSVWYGWQMLIADGAAVGLAAAGATSNGFATTTIGAMSFLVTGPAIHGVHGQVVRALASVAMRLVLPFAGFFVGAGTAQCPAASPMEPSQSAADACMGAAYQGAFNGLVGGMALAAILDASLLAWKPPPAPSPLRAAAAPPLLQWLPAVGVAVDSGRNPVPTFGVAGSF